MDIENNTNRVPITSASIHNKSNTGWKITAITFAIISLALGGFLVWELFSPTEDSKSSETTSSTDKKEGNSSDDKGEEKIAWKTFTTEQMGFQFDYPEGWTIKSKVTTEPSPDISSKTGRFLTTVTSPKGLELELLEDFEGGLGGSCGERENEITNFFKKEADVPSIKNLNVISTITEGHLQVSVTDMTRFEENSLGTGRSVTCNEEAYHSWLSEYNGTVDLKGGAIMYFGGMWDKITDEEEYDLAIKILSSFRQI